MKHLYAFLFVLLFLNQATQAQTLSLSENAEVSILTVGPGKQLFDKFGHIGIRIRDEGMDIVYNYGTYDFNTPNFYTKFARGKLLYKVDFDSFEGFLIRYQRQNREVKEQVLDISYADKMAFFRYLQNNAQPENQYYLYDFFFENCATKPRDVLKEVLGEALKYDDSYLSEKFTFRELIQQNVSSNTWGSLGMDVAIGAVVDKEATPWQHQFLPAYVFEAAATATLERSTKRRLIKETRSLNQVTPFREKSKFFTSPLFVFGLLGLLILFVTYKDHKKKSRSRYLDGFLFFCTGLIGIILCLLWWGTDHSATANNYNLLWAFPFSILLIIAVSKKRPKRWVGRYYIFLVLLLLLLTVHWLTGVQGFAIGFIPLFIALAIRYGYVIRYLKSLETQG